MSGAAILQSSDNKSDAERFIEYLLSPAAQEYFAGKDHEYPLVPGVAADPDLPSLDSLQPPDIDLSDLVDLRGSLELMRDVGILP